VASGSLEQFRFQKNAIIQMGNSRQNCRWQRKLPPPRSGHALRSICPHFQCVHTSLRLVLRYPLCGDKTMRCMILWTHPKRPWMDAIPSAPRPEVRNRMLRTVGLPRWHQRCPAPQLPLPTPRPGGGLVSRRQRRLNSYDLGFEIGIAARYGLAPSATPSAGSSPQRPHPPSPLHLTYIFSPFPKKSWYNK
jgi:hypothetical protein